MIQRLGLLNSLLSLNAPCRSQACLPFKISAALWPDSSLPPDRVKAEIELALPGTISDLSSCYKRRAADVQFFDVVGSRSKRSNCASDDEADARRQKRPARS